MATPVEVPKLGNSVEECIIGRWLKRPGDAVSAGDAVAEIETDKTTFEVTAPVGGQLLATFFDEGAVVPVFTNFFVVGDAGENADAFRPQAAGPGPLAAVAAVVAPVEVAVSVAAPAVTGPMRMSPRARRFAEVHDFHPASVIGSGPGGRILEEDIRKLYEARPQQTAKAAPPSRLRATIARRMRESLSTTAQYTMNSSGGRGRFASDARAPQGVDRNGGYQHQSSGDVLRHPSAARYPVAQRRIRRRKRFKNMPRCTSGFACDTPKGLLVPVVRNAHALALSALAARMRDLTARATAGTIAADDLTGATFTISNLGNLGIETFTPLLQSAAGCDSRRECHPTESRS